MVKGYCQWLLSLLVTYFSTVNVHSKNTFKSCNFWKQLPFTFLLVKFKRQHIRLQTMIAITSLINSVAIKIPHVVVILFLKTVHTLAHNFYINRLWWSKWHAWNTMRDTCIDRSYQGFRYSGLWRSSFEKNFKVTFSISLTSSEN